MTDSRLYTDEDAEIVSNFVPLGFTECDPYRDVVEAAHAILAVAAPRIAARALREAADMPDPTGRFAHICSPLAYKALHDRADEIEAAK